ncbi:MAG: lamin tail domain-containing protein [Gammaproteobacteria bacterium]|jgi:predicted extracellular nuclease
MLTVRYMICIVLLLTTTPSFATLMFSEYVEGSSYNKAVELFNTDSDVDLEAGGYTIEIFSNGSTAASYSFALSGVVAQGNTFVISHSRADQLILEQANLITGSLNFNGDDAIVLLQNGTVLDRMGQVGVDPGSAWGNGTVTTQNHTLRRRAGIVSGDVDTTAAFDPGVQWLGFGVDVFDDLGTHVVDEPLLPPLQPVAAQAAVPAPASVWLLAVALIPLGVGRLKTDHFSAQNGLNPV